MDTVGDHYCTYHHLLRKDKTVQLGVLGSEGPREELENVSAIK